MTPLFLCVRHIRIDPVCVNERLLRRARWLQPVLPKREAREGEYERFAPGLEAACGTLPPGTPPSDANTKPCARRRVLSRRIYPLKIRWSSRARKPVRRNSTRRILHGFSRRLCCAPSSGTTNLFAKSFVGFSTAITTRSARRFRRIASVRPSLEEILAFRTHVDEPMDRLLPGSVDAEAARRTVLGLHHGQQHQELALTDIKHAFFSNPLLPSYIASPLSRRYGASGLENRLAQF